MYQLSKKSQAALVGVHPNLVKVITRAIQITGCDFKVLEGLRTLTRQKRLVATGASTTLNSKHLKQADGFGHASDLLPCRQPTDAENWKDLAGFALVAGAMKKASNELKIPIRWGADWDRDGITKAQGDKDEHFVDSPHFELV